MSRYFFEEESVENKIKADLKFFTDHVFEIQEDDKYAVILHNDPINSVDFVVRVIRSVFGYGTPKSTWLMLKAHFTGKSTLWIGSLKKAEEKQSAMIQHGPDPAMLHKGAQPLTVTVEKSEVSRGHHFSKS